MTQKLDFLSVEELNKMQFKSIGENVLIDKRAIITTPHKMSIGNNVRIDAFCVLSGAIELNNYIHIGAFCYLGGSDGIVMHNYSGLSQRVSIYTKSDNYDGSVLTNPTVPKKYAGTYGGPVTLNKHVIIGSGSVILPNVTIGDGAAVGALSLVHRNLNSWGIYAGVPAVFKKERLKTVLELERKLELEN